MPFKYSPAHINFINQSFQRYKVATVTELFNAKFGLNKSPGQIKSLITHRGLTCGRGVGKRKGEYKLLSQVQVEFVKAAYKKHDLKVTTQKLNKKFGLELNSQQLRSFVGAHGINCGRSSLFLKGQVPQHKGTKGVMKANKSSYQKGHMPINHVKVGSEHINNQGYIEIKTAEPNFWQLKHRYIWGQSHGTDNLPENIRFLDNNRLNCQLENLLAVNNQVNLVLNQTGFNQLACEIKPVALTLAKLEVKINVIKKEKQPCQA